MNGVAMIVSEPVRNDSANPQPIEVRNYQQPAWKALSEFALQSDLEQPAFQQLVSWFARVLVDRQFLNQVFSRDRFADEPLFRSRSKFNVGLLGNLQHSFGVVCKY